jgi:hypothetical protein
LCLGHIVLYQAVLIALSNVFHIKFNKGLGTKSGFSLPYRPPIR